MYATVVLGAMLVLGLIFLQIGLNSAKWAYSHYRDQQALSLAEAAVDRASWMIQASPEGDSGINTQLSLTEAEAGAGIVRTFTSPTWVLDTGSYSFVARTPHKGIYGTTEIRATGTAKGSNREEVLVVTKPVPGPTGGGTTYVPAPCFQYAVFSDHNFSMTGNAKVMAAPGESGAGIYANGNISMVGNPTVYGPLQATGTISITGNFNQVPADAGRVQHAPRVLMPTVDLAAYQAAADETWGTGGTYSKTGNISAPLGTLEHPKIIYVNGKLKLTGNVSMDGVGLIVASNGIDITGNVTYGDPGNTAWGFVTAGTFKITGNAKVYGSVYCHNATGDASFTATGNANVYGAVVADVVTMTGNYMVQWDGTPSQIAALPGTVVTNGPPVLETLLWERI